MKVHQIYTKSQLRNFTYIIEYGAGLAIVIDPWEDGIVNNLLYEKQLKLQSIINTHEHWDHVQGNLSLVKKHHCEVWAHENGEGKIPGLTRTLRAKEEIQLDEKYILEVLDTPGHTFAHLCLLLKEKTTPKAVFTGDTLFNAGVGNCRDGDANILYQTIVKQFNDLSDDVLLYPGHEYLENNLKFTLDREPSNLYAKEWLQKLSHVDPSLGNLKLSMADEKKFNTFFRLENEEIRRGLPNAPSSDKEVFLALRSARNNW